MSAVLSVSARSLDRPRLTRLFALGMPFLVAAAPRLGAELPPIPPIPPTPPLPPISVNGHHFLLPVGDGRLIYRFSDAAPDAVVESSSSEQRDRERGGD